MIRSLVSDAWSENPVRVVMSLLATVAAVPVIWLMTVFAIVAGTPAVQP